jgi:hypothetical protein
LFGKIQNEILLQLGVLVQRLMREIVTLYKTDEYVFFLLVSFGSSISQYIDSPI